MSAHVPLRRRQLSLADVLQQAVYFHLTLVAAVLVEAIPVVGRWLGYALLLLTLVVGGLILDTLIGWRSHHFTSASKRQLRLTLYPSPSNNRLTWVAAPGFTGDPNIVWALSPDGQGIQPGSAFDGVPGQLLTVGYGRYGVADEEQAFRQLYEQLVQLGGYAILLGLSYGGQVLERFSAWYYSLPEAERQLEGLAFVPISAPPSVREVRGWSRLALAVLKPFNSGPLTGWLLRLIAPLFVSARTRQRLRELDRADDIPLLIESVRRSPGTLACLHDLAHATTPVTPTNPSLPVRIGHLPLGTDQVVDAERGQIAHGRRYVGAECRTIDGSEHGRPEVDGPAYAAFLNWVLDSLCWRRHAQTSAAP